MLRSSHSLTCSDPDRAAKDNDRASISELINSLKEKAIPITTRPGHGNYVAQLDFIQATEELARKRFHTNTLSSSEVMVVWKSADVSRGIMFTTARVAGLALKMRISDIVKMCYSRKLTNDDLQKFVNMVLQQHRKVSRPCTIKLHIACQAYRIAYAC